jgi:hypothetical protein
MYQVMRAAGQCGGLLGMTAPTEFGEARRKLHKKLA